VGATWIAKEVTVNVTMFVTFPVSTSVPMML
jgi:hypothetical protein